jgi:hypothetical protein
MRRLALVVAVTAALAVGTSRAGATAQVIRVKVPAVRVCTNTIGGIKVGVRWLSGPRRYRVRVYDPNGKVVLVRRGLATRSWKRWGVRPTLGGVYRTVYTLPGRTVRYRTQSLGCGG